jgi:four helix bundle protein
MLFKSFTNIEVWKKAHQFVLEIYLATGRFPNNEQFGLIAQLRRASSSICANISEGYKKGNREFSRFLKISQGSLEESKYFLILSKDLKYLDQASFDKLYEQVDEVGRMLHGLMASIDNRK